MSVITAYKKGKVIYMACDSQSTVGTTKEYIEAKEQIKIHKYKDYLFGSCGSASAGRLISSNLNVLDQMKKFDKENIVLHFIPMVYNLLLDFKSANIKEAGIEFDNQFMLAKGDKCYVIDCTGVYLMGNYASIGSGSPYVDPFLCDYDSKDDVNAMMINAIKSCSKIHTYVSGDIQLIDTKTLEYEVVK